MSVMHAIVMRLCCQHITASRTISWWCGLLFPQSVGSRRDVYLRHEYPSASRSMAWQTVVYGAAQRVDAVQRQIDDWEVRVPPKHPSRTTNITAEKKAHGTSVEKRSRTRGTFQAILRSFTTCVATIGQYSWKEFLWVLRTQLRKTTAVTSRASGKQKKSTRT